VQGDSTSLAVRPLAGVGGLHALPQRPARAAGAVGPDPSWLEVPCAPS